MPDFQCHFCGYRGVEEELLAKCGKCPLKAQHANMGVSCCPNCGIELRMKSSVLEIVEAFRGFLKKAKSGTGTG